jgi:D-glutamate N-acetyltransferase
MKRRIIIHTDKTLKPVDSKIECELVRYLNNEIIGIIDSNNAGRTVEEVLGFGGDIPIASTLDEFLTLKPNYLLIGASSFVGTFPMEWYPMIIKALQMRIHILNGLHQPLSALAEFDLLAKKYKAKIIDLRESGEKPVKFRNLTKNIQAKKILITGSRENSGELATTLELLAMVHKKGISADWIPTGLSSRLIKGKGFITESLIGDLISGYIEADLVERDQKFEYLFVEGQGSITDPVRASVAIGILHGTKPDAVILCQKVESVNDTRSIVDAVSNYQHLLDQINGAPVVGVSLNTALLSEKNAMELIKSVSERLRVPVIDPLRAEMGSFFEAVKRVEKL